MNCRFISAASLILISASLLSSPASAGTYQQPTEHTADVAKATMQKNRSVAPRPTPTKPAKATVATTAKPEKGHGKRFWSRIMGAFRDVHSAEKKQK